MKITKALAIALALTTASIGMAHADDNHLERTAYQDPTVHQNLEKARTIIEAQGYQITDKLEICQNRSHQKGQKYDIRLDYPNLKNLQVKLDRD